jgi:hypothetical protein
MAAAQRALGFAVLAAVLRGAWYGAGCLAAFGSNNTESALTAGQVWGVALALLATAALPLAHGALLAALPSALGLHARLLAALACAALALLSGALAGLLWVHCLQPGLTFQNVAPPALSTPVDPLQQLLGGDGSLVPGLGGVVGAPDFAALPGALHPHMLPVDPAMAASYQYNAGFNPQFLSLMQAAMQQQQSQFGFNPSQQMLGNPFLLPQGGVGGGFDPMAGFQGQPLQQQQAFVPIVPTPPKKVVLKVSSSAFVPGGWSSAGSGGEAAAPAAAAPAPKPAAGAAEATPAAAEAAATPAPVEAAAAGAEAASA